MASDSTPSTGLPGFALRVYFILACAVLVGLVWIWPKYQARRAGLQTNYEGRVKGHEHRVRQHAEAIAEAQRTGQRVALPSGVTWPVIVAGASLAIPCIALLFALLTGRTPRRPPRGAQDQPPAATPPTVEPVDAPH